MPSISHAPSGARATVVILGTGGTIAGTSAKPGDNVGYTAAQRSVQDLLAAVPALAAPEAPAIEAEQLAQLDSKDMDHATWLRLAQRVQRLLAREDVAGVVITHGTDTLEETAYLLHRALDATHKPLVLTAAMRPASAPSPDGPQNLLDALTVARDPRSRGVLVAFGGQVWPGDEVRKLHGQALQAFAGGPGGPVAVVANGVVTHFRTAESPATRLRAALWSHPAEDWPWVEIVTSHAAARGDAVRALLAAGVRGLVVAGTGNGSIHVDLRTALREAQAAGVPVWRASRCIGGGVVGPWDDDLPLAGLLTPAQARLALVLELLAAR